MSDRAENSKLGPATQWLPAAVIFALIVALFALISMVTLEGQVSSTSDILISTSILLSVATGGMALSIFDRRAALADLFIWIYFVFFMAWPGWIQSLTMRYPWGLRHGPDSTVKGVAVTVAFLLCYAAVAHTLRWRDQRAVGGARARSASSATVLGFLIGAVIVAAACCVLVAGNLFVSRETVGKALSGDTGLSYPFFIGKGVALAGLVTGLATLKVGRHQRVALLRLILTGMLALETLLLFNPLGNPRFQTLGAAFTLIGFYVSRPKGLGKAVAAGALGASTLGLFAAFKQIGQSGTFDVSNTKISQAPFSIDFDSLQQMIATITYVKRYGFLWGENLLSAVLFFVPRQIWPSKSEPTGIVVAEGLNYYYTNLSSPLPAESYVAFGWAGCFGIAAGLAWLVVRLERGAARARFAGPSLARCLYAVMCGYTVILLRGSLGAVLPQFGVVFLTLLGAQVLGVFGRASGSAAPA